jgi:DNA-binding transcriptional ArsR family regulator
MLRIHFTSQDLLRVRLAPGPDPLWEAVLSAHQVNLSGGPLVFGQWRSQVVSGLTPEARSYLGLTPPRGYTPDFLTPAGGATDFGAGLDTMLSTPSARFEDELELLSRRREVPRWAADLHRSTAARYRLGVAAQAFHDQALAPHWSAIRGAVEADVAAHARTLTGGGTQALLASVHPTVTWRDPVLCVDTAADRDVYLEGRGLTLQPAFFCWRAPISLADPELAPVLVYPVPHRLSWLRPPGGGHQDRALAALLGRTRAAALSALTYGASTSELARHIGVSAPSASEHASVLRDAGLIASRRERNSVWHTLTPLGQAVLDGGRELVLQGAASPARTSSASRRAVAARWGSPAAS